MAIQVMSPQLKTQIDEHHIRQGPLFGSVPASAIDPEDQRILEDAGWTVREYQDGTVLWPPRTSVRWDQNFFRFRDAILHQAAHSLAEGLPVAGNAGAIVEEVVGSAWEQRLDQLRTVWGAFAFAALRQGEDPSDLIADDGSITSAAFAMEDQETYFFYTEAMAAAARRTLVEVVKPPDPSDPLWQMLSAIHDTP
jgi:hypothetical protein